ncbi:MAG: hypothetical protein JXB60_08815, partial [Candidatus Cloacimonetes bacterium]|nr:hypothetical protein [Candidatus Cloacimonadota bacterium]
MKKGNFILFISIIFSFLIIIGCSTTDDDDNGNQITEPPFTEEDSDYFLQVVGGLGRDAYSIMLVKYQGANIDSLELLIDSIPVFLQYNDTLFAWVGGWDLTVTQTYNFDVSINESNWNFDLAVPTVPVITWPEWQPPEEVTLEWALDPDMNNMLQT